MILTLYEGRARRDGVGRSENRILQIDYQEGSEAVAMLATVLMAIRTVTYGDDDRETLDRRQGILEKAEARDSRRHPMVAEYCRTWIVWGRGTLLVDNKYLSTEKAADLQRLVQNCGLKFTQVKAGEGS